MTLAAGGNTYFSPSFSWSRGAPRRTGARDTGEHLLRGTSRRTDRGRCSKGACAAHVLPPGARFTSATGRRGRSLPVRRRTKLGVVSRRINHPREVYGIFAGDCVRLPRYTFSRRVNAISKLTEKRTQQLFTEQGTDHTKVVFDLSITDILKLRSHILFYNVTNNLKRLLL
ncbi:hypothetical protein DBR06_SOUSAS2510080, partial [Sousa chinensis]